MSSLSLPISEQFESESNAISSVEDCFSSPSEVSEEVSKSTGSKVEIAESDSAFLPVPVSKI